MSQLSFDRTGHGKPLVFLHGFCESRTIWSLLLPRLKEAAEIINIDLPGFGESPLPAEPFTLNDVAGIIWDKLSKLGIENPSLIGHSLGGYVALAMAQQKPEALASLVLFHSTARPDPEERKLNRNRVMDFVRQHGVQPFIDTFVPGLFYDQLHPEMKRVFEVASKTPSATLLAYTAAMRDRPSYEQVLQKLNCPILFLGGEKDTLIPPTSLVEQAKLCTQAQVDIMPQTGHAAMVENPEIAEKYLKRFFHFK